MEQFNKRDDQLFCEKQCAQVFIDWFNTEHKTKYLVCRTEKRFLDLTGNLRWDFVAYQESSQDWIALEIKEVTVPKSHYVFAFWNRVFRQVNEKIKGKASGTFHILESPIFDVELDQGKTGELINAISQVIIEISINNVVFKPRNIWPDVCQLLSHWQPKFLNNLYSKSLSGEISKPNILLEKTSNIGSYVGITMYSSAYYSELDEKQAIIDIFTPDMEGKIKPDAQLGVAATYGARLKFLLLDAVDWQYDNIAKTLTNVPPDKISNINAFYLVDLSHEEVIKIVP